MKTRLTSYLQLCLASASGILKAGSLLIILLITVNGIQARTTSIDKAGAPVLINQLSIYTSGHNLILSWEADKATFDHFEVERSFDGKHFSTIGLVLDAPENSNTCLFKDKKANAPAEKAVWYRVKGINKDGSSFYSNSSMYSVPATTAPDCTLSVSPNPFSALATFKVNSNKAGFAEVKLQNLDGQTLLSKQSNINKGTTSIQVEGLNKLTTGIYTAQLLVNGVVVDSQRVVKD